MWVENDLDHLNSTAGYMGKSSLKILLGEDFERNINVLDKAIMCMILDSRDHNDEALRMLRKTLVSIRYLMRNALVFGKTSQ